MINDNDIKLYKGDCIEVMQKLIDEGVQVDLTVTSPPYDNLRTYNDSLKWDFDVFKQVADKLYQITADGGVVVWVVGDATINGSETGTSFRQALYFKEIGFNLHDTMIWNKGGFTSVGSLKNKYGQVFDYMFVLSKGNIKTFNPIKDRINKTFGRKINGTIRQKDGSTKPKIKTEKKTGKYGQRFNIWSIPPENSKFNRLHPAQFPESIANDHIISWSNENDIVLDCFMGSGTTGKMAIINNRKFIGIEKVDEYYDIATKRINTAIQEKQMSLF